MNTKKAHTVQTPKPARDVVDERMVRAAAGLALVLGATAFVYAYFDRFYLPTQIISALLFVDFTIRVGLGLPYSPTGVLAAVLTRGRPPQWVSAKPKRFAWSIGIAMSFTMVVITSLGVLGTAPLSICLVCMAFMWLEAVLGICVGCEIYALLRRRGWIAHDPDIQICADGVCTPKE